jgi:hypothetical protein
MLQVTFVRQPTAIGERPGGRSFTTIGAQGDRDCHPENIVGDNPATLRSQNRQRRRPSRSASSVRMRRAIATVEAYVESIPSNESRRLPSVRARVYGVSEA